MKFNKRSIRITLVSVALQFAFVFILLISIYHIHISIKDRQQSLENLNQQIEDIVTTSVEKALWSYDEDTLSSLIEGLLLLKEVESVSVFDSEGQTVIRRVKHISSSPTKLQQYLFKDNLHFVYPIYEPYERQVPTKKVQIGQLEINIDINIIWQSFVLEFIQSTLFLMFLVVSLLLVIERTFYFLLTKPLVKFSKDVAKTNLQNNEYHRISIADFHTGDELGTLCDQFNTTINNLFSIKDELYKLATIDEVTGLPNRNQLKSRLEKIFSTKLSEENVYTVCLMDLDGFKSVNDLLGHSVGDSVLKLIGKRLKDTLTDKGTVFRLGGDEFVIIFNNDICRKEVLENTQLLIKKMAEEIQISEKVFKLSASFGLSFIPLLASDHHILLKQCDIAMYEAKVLGGDQYLIYTPSMEDKIRAHVELSELIKWAIDNNKLLAYYQPKVCTKSKKVVSFELLVRLLDKDSQIIPPDKFIETAEKTRQIIIIGRWAVEEGIKTFHKDLLPKGIKSLAINVSLVQLAKDESFIIFAIGLLNQYGIQDNMIELEITESIFMNDYGTMQKKLKELQSNGFSIALDDFGTGYSSLSRIQNLPINTLKIDRSFVMGLPVNNAIPLTILALARNLNLSVVAEGIETKEQSEWLINQQCTYLQGYLFGKPVLLNEAVIAAEKNNIDL